MICKYCGAPVPMGMNCCPYCGAPVEKSKSKQSPDLFDEDTCFAYTAPLKTEENSFQNETDTPEAGEETEFAGDSSLKRSVPESNTNEIPKKVTSDKLEEERKTHQKQGEKKKASKKMSKKEMILNAVLLVILAVLLFILLRR